MQYLQGDIIKFWFKGTEGHEQSGYRPGLVVSNSEFNEATKFVKVVAITTHGTDFPTHVHLPEGLITTGQVLTEQERTIDVMNRDVKFIEHCPDEFLQTVLDYVLATY